MTNRTHRLYVGVTNALIAACLSRGGSETRPYYGSTTDVYTAFSREKQTKNWRRAKKRALVEAMNPHWKDLSAEWYDLTQIPRPVAPAGGFHR